MHAAPHDRRCQIAALDWLGRLTGHCPWHGLLTHLQSFGRSSLQVSRACPDCPPAGTSCVADSGVAPCGGSGAGRREVPLSDCLLRSHVSWWAPGGLPSGESDRNRRVMVIFPAVIFHRMALPGEVCSGVIGGL